MDRARESSRATSSGSGRSNASGQPQDTLRARAAGWLELERALREALGGPSDDTERAEREKADISELEQARVDILGDHFGIPVSVLVIDDDAAQQEMVQSLFLRWCAPWPSAQNRC